MRSYKSLEDECLVIVGVSVSEHKDLHRMSESIAIRRGVLLGPSIPEDLVWQQSKYSNKSQDLSPFNSKKSYFMGLRCDETSPWSCDVG